MSERMYPIQKGPSVPWSVMASHESRCQKNHQQSINRIAERGGFSPAEAWAIVNNLDFDFCKGGLSDGTTWEQAERKWIEYAERINNHYDELATLRTQLKSVEAERDEANNKLDHTLTVNEEGTLQWWIQKHDKLAVTLGELLLKYATLEADAAVMRGAVELVIDAYSFVSGGSREPISTAMKRPENEMNVFRLVISLNNLKNKCESTNAGKSLLLRLQEAEWLLDHCPDSLDPNPMVNKQWWSRRDTFLNPKPQDVK